MTCFRALIACLALIVACAPAAAANLVVNGGFETGSFTGWSTQAAPVGSYYSVVAGGYEGTYSARFGATNGLPDEIWQSIPTAAGVQFTVSMWVFNDGVGQDGLQILWNGVLIFDSQPLSIPAGAWTQVSLPVYAAAATAELRIRAHDAPAYVHIDGVSVEPDNLIVNPGFEISSLFGWDIQIAPVGADLGIAASGGHSGPSAVRFGATAGLPDEIYQVVPTAPGHVYVLNFWVLNDNGNADSLRVYWEGTLVFDGTPLPLAHPAWVPLTLVVTSTGSSSEVRFAAYDTPSVIFLDDIYLAPPRNPQCARIGDADRNGAVEFADITAVLRNWGAICVP